MLTRPSVTIHSLRLQRRALVMWTLACAALIGMYVAVYPSVKGTGGTFTDLIERMPKAYKALFTAGGGMDFTTPAGYLNTELFSFMGPVVVLLFAIGAGANGIAGEEDRHTLDLLLVQARSRRRILLEKLAAMAAGVVGLVGALWVALLVEGRIASMDVPIANSAAALAHLGLLGIELGAVALLVGAATGRLGLSRAVAAIVAVTAYLLNALAPLVTWLEGPRRFSPFYQYIGHDPLRHGFSIAALAITLLTIVGLTTVAVMAFDRRDVAV